MLNSPSSGPPNRIAPCAVDWARHKRPSPASNHSDSTGRQHPTVLVHLGWRSSSLFGECCGGFVTSLRTRLAVQQWDLTLQSRLLHPVKPLFSDLHLCHTIPGSKHGLKTAEVSLEGFHHNPTARCKDDTMQLPTSCILLFFLVLIFCICCGACFLWD